jgi:hypothetical protein
MALMGVQQRQKGEIRSILAQAYYKMEDPFVSLIFFFSSWEDDCICIWIYTQAGSMIDGGDRSLVRPRRLACMHTTCHNNAWGDFAFLAKNVVYKCGVFEIEGSLEVRTSNCKKFKPIQGIQAKKVQELQAI